MINERALMRQMGRNFKGAGYRVGLLDGGTWLAMNGMTWAVAMPYADASKDLKALIVSHTGEMPGQCVKVQKDTGAQLELEGELQKTFRVLFDAASDLTVCGRTCLYLGELEIWQTEDGRCALYAPELTHFAVRDERGELEILSDGRKLIMDTGTGKACVLAHGPTDGQQETLDFLSGHDWTDPEIGEADDDGQETM